MRLRSMYFSPDEGETTPATEEKKEEKKAEEKKKWELNEEQWEALNKRIADLEAQRPTQAEEDQEPESETVSESTLEAKTLTVSAPPEELPKREEKPKRKSNKGKRAKKLSLKRRKF